MQILSNYVRSKGDPKILKPGPTAVARIDRLGRWLGWVSLGLGLIELTAPRRISETLGIGGQEGLIRAYGAREIASGIVTLSTERQTGLWSRVAGDGLDIATLVAALPRNPKRANVAMALAMILGITALDALAAGESTRRHARPRSIPWNYRSRSGFPGGIDAARGSVRAAETERIPEGAHAA